MQGLLFRGIPEPPVSETDFVSFAERGLRKLDRCGNWGLSVWVTKEDALHALELYGHMQTWKIASGEVGENDGMILATPSNKQPNHHTFWKAHEVELAQRFTLLEFPPASAN